MPQLIKYLDKIAREKQRDVLCISCIDKYMALDDLLDMDFDQHKPYVDVTTWLDVNKMQWQPCGFQNDVVKSGRIYVDVPYDEADPMYRKLADHLENPDGSMKIEGVTFYYMLQEEAMKYAEQEEAGYWERN